MFGNVRGWGKRRGAAGGAARCAFVSRRRPHGRALDCLELEDRIVLSGSPIAVDTTSVGTSNGNVTSLTWAHTVNAGSNGVLVVSVAPLHEAQPSNAITSVTYAGQALTKIVAASGTSVDAELWYLLSPQAGTNNVVVTVNGSADVVAAATDYFNVSQTTPLGTPASANGQSASPSVTATSATGQLVVDALAFCADMAPASPSGSGQTQLWNSNSGTGSGSDSFGAGSYVDGAASVTMSWSVSQSDYWAEAAVGLIPAYLPGTPTITAPASGSLNENTSLVFSGAGGNPISISDPVSAGPTQASLSVASGTLTLASTTGLTITAGANSTAAMTIEGTPADINTALDSLTYAPTINYAGSDSLAIAYDNPSDSETANAAVGLSVLSTTPINTVPGAQTTNANTPLVFSSGSGNQISVAEQAGNPLQETLTATNGTLTLSGTTGLTFTSVTGAGVATMTFTGKIVDINNALDGLSYQPTNNYYGAAGVQIISTDNIAAGGPMSDTNSVAVTVNAGAQPTGSVPGPQTTNENTALVFSAGNGNQLQIVDGNFGSVPTVTLSASDGTLTLGGTTNLTFTSGTGTGDATMTFSGTVADINSALATVTYQPTNNYSGADAVQITTTDSAASPASSTSSVNVTINHVNVVPVNTVPGPQTTNENTALVFSSGNSNQITVSDSAAGNNRLQETLTATDGTLTLSSTTGLTFTSGTGAGDATMTFTGTITDINNALDGLSFQPTGNYFGAASVQIASTDYTGSGGPQTATNTVNVAVNHVNAMPVNTVPGLQTTNENTALVFSSGNGNRISIADPAAGNDPLEETLTATDGTLTLSSTTGLTFTTGTGAGDATMTFTGTVADINNALDGLSFQPSSNYFGAAASVQIASTDYTGSGGPQTATNTVNVAVGHVNATPVNTVPGPQSTNENTALVFSSGGSNQISVSDSAAGNNSLQETLSATNGTLTLNGTTGLTFTAGTGAGDTTMTFTGTITDINNALDGLSFQPTSNYFGAASVQIASSDYTGSGGPRTATNTVNATVNHVNAVPVNTVPAPQTSNENTALVFSSGNGNQVSVADPAAGNNSIQETLTATNGTLTLSGTTGLTFSTGTGAGDATMTFTGTITNINSALDGLTLQPTNNYFGAASVQIASTDYTGSGGPRTATNTANVAVSHVNAIPVNIVPGPQSTNENTALVFSSGNGNQVSVADPAAGNNSLQETLTATNGTLTLNRTFGLTFTSGTGASDTTMTFTGTIAHINNALDGLSFQPTNNYFGTAASVQIASTDYTGSGGPQNATNTANVAVSHVNAVPVNTVPGPQSTNENTALVFSSGNGNQVSVADPAAGNNSLQETLTATNGALTLNGTTGLTFISGTGAGDATMTFTGTITNINNALDGLTLQPTNNYFGAASVQIASTDYTGSGGPQSATNTVNGTVNQVAPAPVVSVPGPQNSQSTGIFFSMATGNAITISDAAVGGAPVQVTLTATNGAITLAGTQGLTFGLGSGQPSAQIVMTGTVVDVNTAMNGMLFRPTAQAAQLQVVANDLGHGGAGGPRMGSGAVAITEVLAPFPPLPPVENPPVASPAPILPVQPVQPVVPTNPIGPPPASPPSADPITSTPVLPIAPPQRMPTAVNSSLSISPLQSLVSAWALETPLSQAANPNSHSRSFESAGQAMPSSSSKPELNRADPLSPLLDDLNAMDHRLGLLINRQDLAVGTALTASTAFAVGYVIWMLRGGMLLTSLIAQLPAWRLVDPLVVLDRLNDFDEEEQESLETMVNSLEDRPLEPAQPEEAMA